MKAAASALALLVAFFGTAADAQDWSVDNAKSKLGFTVLWSNEPFSGAFRSWKAAIVFDPADLAHAHADVSVDLGSETSDEADFDDDVKGAQGFQISEFPTAHFATAHIVHRSGNDYVATGELTIRGVTRSVTLPFALTLDGKHAHMKGTAQVLRTDYGVGQGIWTSPTPVAHEVKVTIDLYATRE